MAGQGSARVTLREIDLSQVRNPQELPQGVPAAVVGPARKGPAFVPQTFASMQQFNETFGSMLENRREGNSNLFGPLALNEWMRNSRAGTYVRVLGVGDGKASGANGKVETAGFVVGNKLVQEQSSGPGKVGDNIHSNGSSTSIARTHMLGCFMEDSVGSRFLCDAGIQKETATASLIDAVDFSNAHNKANEIQLFLPKEIINKNSTKKLEKDVTLTIKLVTALTAQGDVATIANDTVEVLANDTDAETLNNNFQEFLAANIAAGVAKSDDSDYIFNNLSINPSEIFTAIDGNHGESTTITLPAGREGDEAYIVHTSGTAGELLFGPDDVGVLNQKVYFSGAAQAAPVIRGMLMAPQGIVPALNPNSGLRASITGMSEASDSQVREDADSKIYGQDPAVNLIGYVVGDVGSNQDFKLILNGFKNPNKPAVIDCSFDPDSPSYISKVLNTDPTKIEECGHYLYSHWDIHSSVAVPSNKRLDHAGVQLTGNYANMIGFLVTGAAGRNQSEEGKPNYESFESRYQTSKTPWIVSQFFSKGSDNSPRPSTESDGEAYKLFRLHALDDGEVSNTQYRLLVENVRYSGLNQYGSFDLTLERYDSDPVVGQPVAAWKNLSLDSNDKNFVGRVIGDKHIYFDFDRSEDKQRLVENGQYARKNKFVRVELSEELLSGNVPVEAVPTGFQGHSYIHTSYDGNFIEPAIIGNARVFTNVGNNPTETLSQAHVTPLDLVKSINRVVASSLESDDELAWGVKLGYRQNSFDGHKELVEESFNRSLLSWAKYYPALDGNPVLVSEDDVGDVQKGMFSLEKILIPSSSVVDDAIVSWDGAEYQRDASNVTPADGARYVNMSKDAAGGNVRYLKFRCLFQGGFDGVNIFDKEKAELTGIASLREGEDETASNLFVGPTVIAYRKAIDVLSDKSAAEFQLLAIPGQRTSSVTDYAINACEERFDAMFVMDIVHKDALGSVIEDSLVVPGVRQTIKEFENRGLNSSFAAAYFPDVVMRRPSDRAPIVVPPSVGMMGVMSRNDSIADPWFAPAGLSRGRLSAIDSNVQMNRDLLDELYDVDINPIYVPAGRSGEVYAFGQKTLLQGQSALDRINVRRLLIDIRRKVKKVGEQLLFEPNRASTLQRFSSLVEPIMANVQQRRGVTRYKVQIDTTTTTQNDIENNTIRGKIYLQPTKSVEFISLDFVVANTIQD